MMVTIRAIGGGDIGGGSGGGGDTCEGTGEGGGTSGSYVTQADLAMSWEQGDENYYATQDTDHGYRPRIWEQFGKTNYISQR
ncbi:hypothetical protein CK203_029590 [Vitis vinifera]|uniref:Uncharacterized protein n=1 Tax=Vitis vinifera TaxID=29760 RepID=A0A438JCD1_VITVI|nr:hypothetical protein CK203_029590 [Vitis vinifera]